MSKKICGFYQHYWENLKCSASFFNVFTKVRNVSPKFLPLKKVNFDDEVSELKTICHHLPIHLALKKFSVTY